MPRPEPSLSQAKPSNANQPRLPPCLHRLTRCAQSQQGGPVARPTRQLLTLPLPERLTRAKAGDLSLRGGRRRRQGRTDQPSAAECNRTSRNEAGQRKAVIANRHRAPDPSDRWPDRRPGPERRPYRTEEPTGAPAPSALLLFSAASGDAFCQRFACPYGGSHLLAVSLRHRPGNLSPGERERDAAAPAQTRQPLQPRTRLHSLSGTSPEAAATPDDQAPRLHAG